MPFRGRLLGVCMNDSICTNRVALWARLLACVFLVASAIAAWGIVRQWLLTGRLPFSLADVPSALLFSYLYAVFGWAAFIGKVPRFFPLGAWRWPFRPPGA